jgi:hypothetical protein
VSINKNFVVRHGFEVSTDLILANADTRKVGVGSTNPQYTLDVAGGIGATDFYLTGIGTFVDELNVGLGGTVLTVLGLGNSIGIGTALPAYLVDIRSPVSTGQTALYVQGDVEITGDIRADDLFIDDAEIQDLTVTDTFIVAGLSTFSSNVFIDASLNVSGVTTLGNYVDINSSVDIADDLNVSGVTSTGSLSIGSTQVISDTFELQNITSLDAITIATIEAAIEDAPNNFTDINVSGIATLGTVLVSSGIITATSGIVTYYGDGSNLTGIAIAGGDLILGFTTVTELNITDNLFVSGISTFGNIVLDPVGIITAVSGIVTYYGDGSNLINLPPGSPSGSNTQVQYNNNGFFDGSSNLTHDGTTTRILSGIVTTISGTNLNYTGIGTITNFSGTNINVSGIVTATSFSGNLQNTLTLNTSGVGLSGSTTFNNSSATTFTVTSNATSSNTGSTIVARNAAGGFSAGIITASSFVGNVTGNATGLSGTPNLNVGIVTATSFFGDGSGLTGVGSTVSDDTTTNQDFYPLFTQTTTGIVTSTKISTTKLSFNPSTGTLTVIDLNSTSDISLKENIHTVENALETVSSLRGVSFDWKETGKSSYGVIAQELLEVLPELVKDGDVKSVNYNGIIGVLIEAIKELKAEVEELKSKS